MTRPFLYVYSLITPFMLSLVGPVLPSDDPTLEMDTSGPIPGPIAECAEGSFTWQGGRPPYTLRLRLSDSDSESDSPIFSKDNLSGTAFQWVASVAAGTNPIVDLTDTGTNGAGPSRISNNREATRASLLLLLVPVPQYKHFSFPSNQLSVQRATDNLRSLAFPYSVPVHYPSQRGLRFGILSLVHQWCAFADAHGDHKGHWHGEHREHVQPDEPGRNILKRVDIEARAELYSLQLNLALAV